MSEWKTFEEILPAIGQLMIDDPERGYEKVERQREREKGALQVPTSWSDVFSEAKKVEYRIKPRTVTRTVTYPEPLQERPECGETYWTIDGPSSHMASHFLTWWGQQVDERAFARGMCFATREDARAAHCALFGGE